MASVDLIELGLGSAKPKTGKGFSARPTEPPAPDRTYPEPEA
jgi:hypothetical protein